MHESSVTLSWPPGQVLRLSAVTQLRHAFTAKVNVDASSDAAGDLVNGARNQPTKLTLSILESGVGYPSGRCRLVLECLERLKRTRQILTVETALHTYSFMLLSDLTVIQDDRTGEGFSATLIFTEVTALSQASASAASASAAATGSSSASAGNTSGSFSDRLSSAKFRDNSSTPTYTGSLHVSVPATVAALFTDGNSAARSIPTVSISSLSSGDSLTAETLRNLFTSI